MELAMRLRCRQLPPNTNQPPPPPSAIGAGAWARRSHRRRVRSLQVASRPDSRHLTTTAISASDTGQGTKLRADKFFQVEMTVRDFELDQYGVVNNAVYADYIEKAREVMAEADSLGIGRDSIARTGKAMALSDLKLNYLAPLKVVLEATATVVCLNEDYRPTRVFPEVASKLVRFFSS